jgi:hypothetical protein
MTALRKSAEACAIGRCDSCGGGLIRGGGNCECWCHRRAEAARRVREAKKLTQEMASTGQVRD